MSSRYPNRHVAKPVAYDPRSGHGPEFTQRVVEVMRKEPDLEGWQLRERFGLSRTAIDHYRERAQRKAG